MGNPTVAPECPEQDVVDDQCPTDSQIGTFTISFMNSGQPTSPSTGGLYNVVPQPGQTAVFGAEVNGAAIRLVLKVRSDGDTGSR